MKIDETRPASEHFSIILGPGSAYLRQEKARIRTNFKQNRYFPTMPRSPQFLLFLLSRRERSGNLIFSRSCRLRLSMVQCEFGTVSCK